MFSFAVSKLESRGVSFPAPFVGSKAGIEVVDSVILTRKWIIFWIDANILSRQGVCRKEGLRVICTMLVCTLKVKI